MNEMIKSIRVGTVDFFGILVPGLLAVVMCSIGFFIPLFLLILDLTRVHANGVVLDSTWVVFTLFVIVVFSYVLGYILRLSSPDELDKISARKVVARESKINDHFPMDEWPFNPENPIDKYPYFNFRNYLIRRGHAHLTKDLVTWGSDEKAMNGELWPDKGKGGQPVKITKRSKSTVNKMKIDIRMYCPELTGLLEGKEGHIRLMAGTWAAFRFSKRAVGITLIILAFVALAFQSPGWLAYAWKPSQNYFIFLFVSLTMWLILYFSNNRIEKLFHYRRASELFHIVQAAYIAQQVKQDIKQRK
jgi:hypothetical protein